MCNDSEGICDLTVLPLVIHIESVISAHQDLCLHSATVQPLGVKLPQEANINGWKSIFEENPCHMKVNMTEPK